MTASIDTKERPSVSVVMIAYNNARYIGRAIEGVVLQRADFPIELWKCPTWSRIPIVPSRSTA